MFKKILYYHNFHGGNNLPSTYYIFFNRIWIFKHAPNVKSWALELSFKNRMIGFATFFKYRRFDFHKNKKTGALKLICLRLGVPIIDIIFSRETYNKKLANIKRYEIQDNFFVVNKYMRGGKLKWALIEQYYRDPRTEEVRKLYEPKGLKIWDKRPSKNEVYTEMMLNDFGRWNTKLYEGDKIEISEYVYDHMLCVLPPRNWRGSYFECGEPNHHDEKTGKAIHQAFHCIDGKYYTGHPKAITGFQ